MSEQTSRPATVRDLKRLLESLPDDMPLVNYDSYWGEDVETLNLYGLPEIIEIFDASFFNSSVSGTYTVERAKSNSLNSCLIENKRMALWI